MNRTALGLAIGAGYLLGRTRKLKVALAIGSAVAGKKLNPKMLADTVNQQLKNNPQFKEIGGQLRQDLRGVGKAASGAMVERQMNALADRLHSRTEQVRDHLSGVAPTGSDEAREEDGQQEEPQKERGEPEQTGGAARGDADKAPRKKPGDRPAKQGMAKKSGGPVARKAPAAKKAAKRTDARDAAARRTAAVGGAARSAASRQSEGDDR
jgi:hypothetical protein